MLQARDSEEEWKAGGSLTIGFQTFRQSCEIVVRMRLLLFCLRRLFTKPTNCGTRNHPMALCLFSQEESGLAKLQVRLHISISNIISTCEPKCVFAWT